MTNKSIARAVDHVLSSQLIGDIAVQSGKCHRNAIAVLRTHPELSKRLQYVEGCCSAGAEAGNKNTGGQHSWLMLDDVIIEVTPNYEETTVSDYFPVLFLKWRTANGSRGDETGTVWHTHPKGFYNALVKCEERYEKKQKGSL